jgi:hypothetical protein
MTSTIGREERPRRSLEKPWAVAFGALLVFLALPGGALAWTPPPPPPGTCAGSVMRFTAAYERLSPTDSLHTTVKNLHWVTQSIVVGGMKIVPDGFGPTPASGFFLNFYPFRATVSIPGTSLSQVLDLQSTWYVGGTWGYGGYLLNPKVLNFKDGATTYKLTVFHATFALEYPQALNKVYTADWDLCYKANVVAQAAPLPPDLPGQGAAISLLDKLVEEMVVAAEPDPEDGPAESGDATDAKESLEAVEVSIAGILAAVQERPLPEPPEQAERYLGLLEQLQFEVGEARRSLEQAIEAGPGGEFEALRELAVAHLQSASAVMHEMEALGVVVVPGES